MSLSLQYINMVENNYNSEHDDELWDDEVDNESPGQDSAPVERMTILVSKKQDPERIDKYVMSRIENATRNKIQQAIDAGNILVNGEQVKSNYKVRPNDEIVVIETRSHIPTKIIPEDIPLNIAYEDDHLLIINKPDGMVVHPGSGNYSGTLVNGLAHYLHKEIDTTHLSRIGLVHRIDKDTTGLLLVGKNEEIVNKLAAQFKKHTVHRRYIALVWGDVKEDSGTINAHIGRHQRFRKMFTTYPEGDSGKEAITHYKVVERFNYVTLIELRLETGRTHQIRVHMKHIGHPLFNDSTYGGDRIVKGTVYAKYKQFIDNCFKTLPRHALHAKELGFVHPANNQQMMFDSELPDDMIQVLQKWANYTQSLKKNKTSDF